MITGEVWKLFDDNALQKLDEAAVRLLTQSGCQIRHDELLGMLEGAGCSIDRPAMRCRFPERLIREAIEHLGGHCTQEVQLKPGWKPQQKLAHRGSQPHLLDWPSGRRRLATRQDVVDMARMAHVLDEFHYVGKVLTCCEVDQRIEPLWVTLQLAEITDKPIGGGEILRPEVIEPLVRMGEVLSGRPGDTSLVATCDFFISPLTLDATQAECFLQKRRFDMTNAPGTMPISGMSAPVTVAGTVTVAVAELIAGWVLGYVVNPDLPASGGVSSGSLDMQTASACFGSPEAMLQDAATVQVCRRLYGIPVVAVTGYVDCKRPGLEAVFQKMYTLVGAPFGTGFTFWDMGLLSAGQDYSPVQHLLDAEMTKAVERFLGTFEVNEDTIAVELIEQMIQSDRTNFLETDHTLAHFRSEHWHPRWLDRTLWQGQAWEVEAEREMLARIDHYCKDAIRRYERPDIDEARLKELRRILAAAERHILSGSAG
jgi:trimethylamine--corrinoid protein Co-methyltransferase